MTKQSRYSFHPYSEHFEMLAGDDKAAFVADLKANGLADDITLFEGMILDGRNRYVGCEEAGIECRFVVFDGSAEQALSLVKSRNMQRRHSTREQRAFAAARLATLIQGQRPSSSVKLKDEESDTPPKTQEQAAAEMGVTVSDLQRAKKVVESCAKPLQDAVKEGEISLSDAAKVADLPKRDQAAALKAVESGDAKSVASAAKATMLSKLDPAVKLAWDAEELNIGQAKKLAAMDRLDQVIELKKIRAKAAKTAKANAPSTQVVAGHRTESGPKPPANEKPKGNWAPYHKLLGKLVRTIDECAKASNIPTDGPRVKAVQNAFNEAHKLVLALERCR